MIAIRKTNLWVAKTTQIVRRSLTNGITGTGSLITDRSSQEKAENKPVEETLFITPPKTFPPFNNSSFYDYVRILSNQKVTERPGGLDREIVNHMRQYIGDQVKYYRKLARLNNSAMKRIERLKKKWEKHCDKDYE